MGEHVNDAFVEKVNLHMGIAHKVCGLYFDYADERDDVLQEMMYQLWRSYKSFDGRSKFSTWMYKVCLNTALTYQRKYLRGKTEALTSKHHQIEAEIPNGKDGEMDLLHKAIGELSSVNKGIILLYLEDLSYEEIASVTGLTKSNISVRLVRIKKELESKLKRSINAIEDVKQ